MRKNISQSGTISSQGRRILEHDWFPMGIPSNIELAENVYIDTAYGFASFYSNKKNALFIDEASGCYDRTNFVVGTEGVIKIGKFTILNGTTLICNQNICIGNHCMLAWGSVVTDSGFNEPCMDLKKRQTILKKTVVRL